MNDKQIDELIDRVLKDEQSLPEGLSERLEQYVDNLSVAEKGKTVRHSIFRAPSFYWISGIAATLLVGMALFFQTEINAPAPVTADTFDDPKEAAIAAGNALAFMSKELNKGLDQVDDAKQNIEKVNQIINKTLK